MNKKQKVLTLVALIAFVIIGALHYLAATDYFFFPHAARATPRVTPALRTQLRRLLTII